MLSNNSKKERAIAMRSNGKPVKEIAAKFKVTVQTVHNWINSQKTMPAQKSKSFKGTAYGFKIDSEWKPSRFATPVSDPYITAICDTAFNLSTKGKPGQSFPVPVTEMSRRFGTKPQSTASAIRHILKKQLKAETYSRLRIHEVRNGKNVEMVRVRYHEIS